MNKLGMKIDKSIKRIYKVYYDINGSEAGYMLIGKNSETEAITKFYEIEGADPRNRTMTKIELFKDYINHE